MSHRTFFLITLLTLQLVGIDASFAQPPQAVSEQYQQALATYNEAYESYLVQKMAWPEQIENLQQNVQTAREELDKIESESKALFLVHQQVQSEYVSQTAHLEFLKELEPLSHNLIEQVKTEAVAAKEFVQTSEVTPASLLSKSQQLRSEIQERQQNVAAKEQQISAIEEGKTYQNLLSARRNLVRRRDQKRNEISQGREHLSQLNNRRDRTEVELRNSQDREREARQQAINIRTSDLPVAELERRRLERGLSDLQRDRSETVRRRDRALSQRDQDRSELQRREAELDRARDELENLQQRKQQLNDELSSAQTPEEKEAIGRRIEAINNRIQDQRFEIDDRERQVQTAQRQLEESRNQLQAASDALENLDREISQQQRQLEITEQDIRNLENQVVRLDEQVGDEQIRQIDIENELRRVISEIRNQESELESNQAQLISLERQVSEARQDIEAYRRTHIAPIESAISLLEGEIDELEKRNTVLVQFRDRIVREVNNIATAKEKIPLQEQIVVDSEARLQVMAENLKQVTSSIDAKKNAVDTEIEAYNQFIQSIRKTKNEFDALEAKALELKNQLITKGE